MYSIHLEKSTAYAVSRVRKTRLLYFDGRRGVRLQASRWDSAQAGRHALDHQGRQRHHRPALQQAQRTLRRFLATPLRAETAGRMTLFPKSDVRPGRRSSKRSAEPLQNKRTDQAQGLARKGSKAGIPFSET